ERDVEAVGCLGSQMLQMELELLRPKRGGQRGAEGEGSYGSHCSVPFNCICTRFSLLPAIRMAVMTCSLATCPWCWRQASPAPVITRRVDALVSHRGLRCRRARTRPSKPAAGSFRASAIASSCSNQSITLHPRRGAPSSREAALPTVEYDS